MKKHRMIAVVLAVALTSVGIAGCGGNPDEDGKENGGNSETPPPTEKVIDESRFSDPETGDRPMVMMHDLVERSNSSERLDEVFARGYGGIVTNVAWRSDYLQDSRSFSSLHKAVKHAVEDNGMYVWLYDEYGYPSGTAHGQTLKGNPEYEALGLVPQYKTVPAGGEGTIELLHGHKEIVSAYVYSGTAESFDLSSGEDVSANISQTGQSVTYRNDSAENKTLVAYMSKRWYENTHSMENWYAQQRYINLLEPEPARKFIDLTYQSYYEELGEYFGNGIRAFFTDEPALQGSYFEISDRSREVLDTPDPNVPIVECLNFSDSLFEVFEETYGYDLRPKLIYLYRESDSAVARQTRMDFYALTSELFRRNYLGAIADWCSDKDVKSSGHLLLEETLYQNPWFAGDMLQLLGTMGIPGSDLLFSQPQSAMKAACVVSKMASSAADFTGKSETFAEISGAFDGYQGDVVEQINAVGVQVCMGINNFASYYFQDNKHTEDEDHLFSAALGRMKYMVSGTKHDPHVALYYPYEGVCAETLPSRNMYSPTESAKKISDGFGDMCKTLTEKQIDYDLVDYVNLSECSIEDGAIVTPQGQSFEVFVLPYTTALQSSTVLKLIEAAAAGVRIFVQNVQSVVCEQSGGNAASRFEEVYGYENVSRESTGVAIANSIRNEGYATLLLDDPRAVYVYGSKRICEAYTLYTVVNASASDKEYTFTLSDVKGSVRYFNTLTGRATPINATETANGVNFKFTLPGNTTGFFVVE